MLVNALTDSYKDTNQLSYLGLKQKHLMSLLQTIIANCSLRLIWRLKFVNTVTNKILQYLILLYIHTKK